jgi:hypothetical protein
VRDDVDAEAAAAAPASAASHWTMDASSATHDQSTAAEAAARVSQRRLGGTVDRLRVDIKVNPVNLLNPLL